MSPENLEVTATYCYHYDPDGRLIRITDKSDNSVRPPGVEAELWDSLDHGPEHNP